MLRHVSLLRFTDATTAADVRAITEALVGLPARLAGLRSYHFGTDLCLADDNADFAVVADFEDLEAFVEYRDDPEHRRIIAELIAPHLVARTAVQYEI
jgi:hypothetical protein